MDLSTDHANATSPTAGWRQAFKEAVRLLDEAGLQVAADAQGRVIATRDGMDVSHELDMPQSTVLGAIRTTIDSATKATLPRYRRSDDVLARGGTVELASAVEKTHLIMRSAGLMGIGGEDIEQLLQGDGNTVDMLDDWEARLMIDVSELRSALDVNARPARA